MKKVVLVDGNNILFRSYYATAYTGNTMKNSKGFPTNALYGLINMLNKIISEEKPLYIVVALDKGKTFRHDKYEVYKQGRIEMPDELRAQFPVAKEIINAMGIKYLEIDNYEADDIIGTFSKLIEKEEDLSGVIISSDKDLLQLISDKVEVKLLKQTDYIRFNRQVFFDTYGFEPIKMIDLKSLMGDSSDNIPGVKGIGEKTALDLLHKYDSLEGVYEHIDEIKGKLQEKLIEGKESAFMSKDIATIYRDIDMNVTFEDIKYNGIDKLKYIELLENLEFYSIIKKLDLKETKVTNNLEETKETIVVNNLEEIKKDDEYAIYLELLGTNYHEATPLGISLVMKDRAYYIPFELLKSDPNFFKDGKKKYTYNLKKLLVVFKYHNFETDENFVDLIIALYLLNYNIKDDISYVARNFGYEIPFYEEEFGTPAKLSQPDDSVIISNSNKKCEFIYKEKENILSKLKEENQEELFYDIEMLLVFVLADMEYTGILVSREFLLEMGEELKVKLSELENTIYDMSHEKFNIMSPKQLGDVLFNKMGLKYPGKVKGNNYSTSKEVLDKIRGVHPIIDVITDYRTYAKLYNNYVTGLVSEIKEDGKIHTTYNQTLTRTGRLSSDSPNLQNIPVRLEYGRLIRKAFIPHPGNMLVSFDYSQIELRVFAHMSKAENLVKAFIEDKDIHKQTASDIFNVDISEVTPDMRRTAKAVNFGILYGISSFGLSEDLGIDVKSAKNFIDKYLETYPGIKEYMEEEIKEAYKLGYVTTIMNRKRTIDELKNKNYMIRSQGERMALNTPIQGSSADILKKAMIDIYREFKKRDLKSKLLLQVHDELVFEVVKEEQKEVIELVKDKMENAYNLIVPLKVDVNIGNNWYEAK